MLRAPRSRRVEARGPGNGAGRRGAGAASPRVVDRPAGRQGVGCRRRGRRSSAGRQRVGRPPQPGRHQDRFLDRRRCRPRDVGGLGPMVDTT